MAQSLDCMLCILRQSLDAARFATPEVDLQKEILEQTMRVTLESGLDSDPPTLGTIIHRIVREVADDPDPYYKEKRRFNQLALGQLGKCVVGSKNPTTNLKRRCVWRSGNDRFCAWFHR